MNTALVKDVTEKQVIKRPNVKVGDKVEVSLRIKEGDKERLQVFKGLVIAVKGKGNTKTFTVRKISFGVGVEKTFLFNSPIIKELVVAGRGKVRRSKLYYMRERIGRRAMKIKGEQIIEEVKQQTKNKPEDSETEANAPEKLKE
ncbi:50S ribosomal protein L19 [Candidatus Dojkabacteria bacterium]|nr:50S ribosomal protein L19 [Candidatus Dojkabacteria bacterium]